MHCRLCRLTGKVVNSHILPEWLYASMYDPHHRFHEISTDPHTRNKYRQKGLREKLLCVGCEQKLSVWEEYAKRFLHGGAGLSWRRDSGLLFINGVDYTKLKLFQLSVLWRASASTLPMFKGVHLNHDEDEIAKLLLRDDPGASNDYGCVLHVVLNQGVPLKDLIVEPHVAQAAGYLASSFVFGGLACVYFIGRHIRPELSRFFVQENGTCIVRLADFEELKFLVRTAQQLVANGKFT